jgi:hypothetical protein
MIGMEEKNQSTAPLAQSIFFNQTLFSMKLAVKINQLRIRIIDRIYK